MVAVRERRVRRPGAARTPITTRLSTAPSGDLFGRARLAQTLRMAAAVERALAELARGQGGVLHERDLVAATGRSNELRRRLRSALWQEVLPRVIAPGLLPVDRALTEAAAMLWAPNAWLSHHNAARREDIWVPEADNVRLGAAFDSPYRSRPGVDVIRTRHVPPLRTDGVLRWTEPARTIVDLAQFLEERALSAVLLSAVRKKKATASEVAAVAVPLAGRAGLAMLSRVVGLWTPERESLLEDSLHADVSTVAIGMEVRRQVIVRNRAGTYLGRADVAIEELRLAFEADGLLFHSTDEQIAADQRRDRQFLSATWQTARFREGVFEDRAVVRRDIAGIIDARRRQLRVA
jgi:very-short-patch-repair endonuclease